MGKFNNLITLNKDVYIASSSSVVGNRENEGPLGSYFDITLSDDRFGMKTFEQGESEMIRMCSECAVKKLNISIDDVDLIIGGDLQNQCVANSFAFSKVNTSYIGIYGACSSMAEGLGIASILLDTEYFKNIYCSASSHFSTSERQFRFPLEYGLQRTPTSQTTVTGAGGVVLSNSLNGDAKIKSVIFGSITDSGIKDANNMGAAMANAALDTMHKFFVQSGYKEKDFDYILTGDLGIEGANIVRENAHLYSLELKDNYVDCGELIFDPEKQSVVSGGSGCGCSAVVLSSYIMNLFKNKKINDVLFIGTGALLSSGSVLQKLSIPSIAHLVHITKGDI